jgi:hypothetical protein
LKKKLQIALLGMLLKNSKSLEDLVFHSPIIIDFMIEAMGGARVNYCLSTDTAKNFLALAATEKGQKILTHEVPFLTSDFVLNLTYREFLKELGFSVSPKTSLEEISPIFARETWLKIEKDGEFKFQKGESFLNAVRLSLDHEKMRTALLGGAAKSKDLFYIVIPIFREGFEALIQAAKKSPEIKAHLTPAVEKYFRESTIAAESSPSGLTSLIQWAEEDPEFRAVFINILQSTFKSSKRNTKRDNLNRSVLIQLMKALPTSVERRQFLKDLEDDSKNQDKEAVLNIRRLITEKDPKSDQSILDLLDLLDLDQESITTLTSVPAGIFAGVFSTSLLTSPPNTAVDDPDKDKKGPTTD